VTRRRPVAANRYREDPAAPGTCGTCHLIEGHASHTDPPEVDPAVAAEQARRLGERTEP